MELMSVDEIELGVKEAVIRTIFARLLGKASNNLTSRSTRLTGIFTGSSAAPETRDEIKLDNYVILINIW